MPVGTSSIEGGTVGINADGDRVGERVVVGGGGNTVGGSVLGMGVGPSVTVCVGPIAGTEGEGERASVDSPSVGPGV